MTASCGRTSEGLPNSCSVALANKRAQGDVMMADSTASEVQRNSAWGLRLAAAQAVTRFANTAGGSD
jgi:hypothetical protein